MKQQPFVFALVAFGVAMPIGAVNLQRYPQFWNQKINTVTSNLPFGNDATPQLTVQATERFSNRPLKIVLTLKAPPTNKRTEATRRSWADAVAFMALGAFDVTRWPPTGFGAILPYSPMISEALSASETIAVPCMRPTAGERTYGISVSDDRRDGKIFSTNRASFRHGLGLPRFLVALTTTKPPLLQGRSAWEPEWFLTITTGEQMSHMNSNVTITGRLG